MRIIEFGDRPFPPANLRGVEWVESAEKTRRYTEQINEYFAGSRTQFDFPLDLRGTDFQKSCWQALLDIPYGATCSYVDIARTLWDTVHAAQRRAPTISISGAPKN